jgi:hypothetical protein
MMKVVLVLELQRWQMNERSFQEVDFVVDNALRRL